MDEPIIGRDRERAELDATRDVASRSAVAVILVGSAGAGKTTLWRAAVEGARARGLTVLEASPARAEARLSYAALGTSSRILMTPRGRRYRHRSAGRSMSPSCVPTPEDRTLKRAPSPSVLRDPASLRAAVAGVGTVISTANSISRVLAGDGDLLASDVAPTTVRDEPCASSASMRVRCGAT